MKLVKFVRKLDQAMLISNHYKQQSLCQALQQLFNLRHL